MYAGNNWAQLKKSANFLSIKGAEASTKVCPNSAHEMVIFEILLYYNNIELLFL